MASNKTKTRRKVKNSANAKNGRLFVATRYDSARHLPDFDWRWQDSKSADYSMTADVRKRIRERARYEVANNSYATGAGWSIVNAVIPNLPKLQFTPIEKTAAGDALAKKLESDFSAWAHEIRLAEKLRSMRFAKFQDGETFAILHENARLRSAVKLDLSPIDCDRVTNLDRLDLNTYTDPKDIDGVHLDDWGNAVSYRVLTRHPGDPQFPLESKTYKADKVLHWFRRSSPEQHRGVSELTPSLLLFQYLRRYTFSVVRASEVAADLALILKTNDTQVYSSEVAVDSPIIETNFSRGSTMALPEGFDATQLKAEQPTAQFSTLVDELLGAIGASLGLPRLVMRKSATGFTYASARVDLSEMERFVAIEREELTDAVISPLFYAFLKEWKLINRVDLPEHTVTWYFAESIGNKIDPNKEATAQTARLANGTTTLAIEYAAAGRDWEEELEQRAIELAKIKELEEKYNVIISPTAPTAGAEDETDDGGGDDTGKGGEE